MNATDYEASAHRCKAAAYRQQGLAYRANGQPEMAAKCDAIAAIELDMADAIAELAQRAA